MNKNKDQYSFIESSGIDVAIEFKRYMTSTSIIYIIIDKFSH